MNNSPLQVFAGGWEQLPHANQINSTIPPGTLIFLVAVVWKPDGTTFFALDAQSNDKITQYTVPTPHITTGASRVGEFSINALETNPRGMDVSKDGKMLWILGTNTKKIIQLDMITGWDINTMSDPGVESGLISLSNPQGFTITNKGKSVYIVDATNDIMQYSLGIANDVTTLSLEEDNFDISVNSLGPRDVRWHPNGMMYFVASANFNNVSRYIVTTKFDINTSSFADKLTGLTGVQGFTIREHDGKRLYVIDNTTQSIVTFEMSLNTNNAIITTDGEELATTDGDTLVYA